MSVFLDDLARRLARATSRRTLLRTLLLAAASLGMGDSESCNPSGPSSGSGGSSTSSSSNQRCSAGQCYNSNGNVCCPSNAQYYCPATGLCYRTTSEAMSASNGRCTDFRTQCF